MKIFAKMARKGKFKVPRLLARRKENMKLGLHVFCDAPMAAYAAAVYLRIKNNNEIKDEAVYARGRLAPLKEITIPRLELIAILIGIRVLGFVEAGLQCPNEKIVWTHSKCAIDWINITKAQPTFVANKVKKIRAHAGVHLQYIRSSKNPADMGIRGMKAIGLEESIIWRKGPDLLKNLEEKWKQGDSSITDKEEKELVVNQINRQKISYSWNLLKKFLLG